MRWLPWPRRADRKADIEDAAEQAEQSRRAAAKAARLSAELRAIQADEFAQAIVSGLRDGAT